MGIALSGMILKASMVLSGQGCAQQAPLEQVARETLRCLRNTVPAAVPGVAFLSGGQSDAAASQHLNAINVLARGMHAPWRLTFSYARALQHAPLQLWRGSAQNVERAQQLLLHRARLNAAASTGRYTPHMEQELAA